MRSSFARRFQLSEIGAHRTPPEILDLPLDSPLCCPIILEPPMG